jgi:citrate synthase
MTQTDTYVPGLEGVIAAQTRLSRVDGLRGELVIGGFPLEEVAAQATFEEMVYLLWHDALPTAGQLEAFRNQLAELRTLPAATLALLREAATAQADVMDALLMGVSTLNLGVGDQAGNRRLALRAIAAFPTIVAAYWQLRNGQTPIQPNAELGHAANYLYMLFGEEPQPARVRGLETYLNAVVDHGLNASTFAARVIIATKSDMISAMVGGVGALKGPLHGGAPGPALDMVFEIGSPDKAEPHIRQKLDRGERLMGFGHRIYKVRDPRADVLSAAAEQFYQAAGDMGLYELARHVEKTAVDLLAEYKPGRNLQTNVEFYTALLLHGLGFPPQIFTPTFAVARVGGWTAHCFEQDRLIRPNSVYIGAEGRTWQPLDQR